MEESLEATMRLSRSGTDFFVVIILCFAEIGLSQTGTDTTKQLDDPTDVIKNAIENQKNYLSLQKRRACRYTETARFDYGTGQSRSHKSHSDELYFNVGGENPSQVEGDVTHPDLSSSKFDLWNHPLFQAILNHSIFSRASDRISWDGRVINIYKFAPDPAFTPSTDIDRSAQAIDGTVSIDQNTKIFVGLTGYAFKDIYDGKRLLVLGPRIDHLPIPVFFYGAAPYDEIIVPTVWDEATFSPVKRGDKEVSSWLGTLTRTFVQIQSCRVYKVDSTMQPGFRTLDSPQPPQ